MHCRFALFFCSSILLSFPFYSAINLRKYMVYVVRDISVSTFCLNDGANSVLQARNVFLLSSDAENVGRFKDLKN